MLKIILTLALVAGALFQTSYADNCDEDSVESSPIEDNSIEDKNAQKCKKPNEEYVICPPKCPFQVCGIDDNLLDCIPQPQPGDPTCPEPACRCKSQFFRDDKGNCVPWEKCPTCSGKNEEYDACDAPCPARRCDFDQTGVRCMSPPQVGDKECLVGCRCKDGFYRNSKKVCVPWEQCQKSCPLNEYYSQCKNSPFLKKTCEDLNKEPKIDRTRPSQVCEEGCVCKNGYLRAKNGTCIPNLQCNVPLPKCTPNEVLTPCGQDGCLKRYCSDLHQGPVCRDRATCTPICECKEGFLRASYDNNTCVPISECPMPKCGDNEEYSQCSNGLCDYQDCKDKGKTKYCPPMAPGSCIGGCICSKNFLRNNNGVCVRQEECEDNNVPKCGDNKEYSQCSNGLCDYQDCKDKGKTKYCPPMAPGSCIGGCICSKNFLRNNNGVCVRQEECEDNNAQCPKNEKYEECPSVLCRAQTCEEAGNVLTNCNARVEGEGCPGKPGCICKDGFLRDGQGVCVSVAQCSSCGRDNNATFGCGQNCRRTCSTYKSSSNDSECRSFCPFNGCECRPEYVLDEQTRKCVLPGDCSPPCPLNEYYSLCTNSAFSIKDCKDINKKIDFKNIGPSEPCQEGCVCQPGYLRAANGTCVPTLQCDAPLPKCKPNQELSPCGRDGCLKMYCSDLDLPPLCRDSFTCLPTCECVEGFLRASFDNDTCVLIEECPIPQCGVNKEYSNCSNSFCDPQECTSMGNKTDCPPVDPEACFGGCICSDNFLRNKNGTCVRQEECENNTGSTTTEETPVTDETTTSEGSGSICDPQLQQETLSEGNTYLTGKVFYQVVKNNPGVSTFMSGFSLLPPLTQLLLYSFGKTNQELKNALNLEDQYAVRCGLPGLLDSIKGTNGTVLELGAKTYVYEGGKLSPSFQEDSKKTFRSTPENIDFNIPQAASDTINQWVSEVTKGKITDLVNPDMFDSSTRLVLANAIYFKGIWKTQFNTNNTKPRDFHVSSDKVIQVPTMQQKGNFFYAELSDPDVQVLELKYNDGETSCVIVLPKQVDGLLSVVEKFQDPKFYKNILNSLQNVKVTVNLPRIPEITTETDLVKVLKAVGVNAIFDSEAQLSGMLDPDEPLYVSSAVQKATVTIDEKGSEAAAANAFVVSPRAVPRPPPIEFLFDARHPFMFIIKRKDLILFTGTYVK